jgi:hypothetical protein
MEAFEEDLLYIVVKQNLTSLLGHASHAANETPDALKKESQTERIQSHFSQLSRETRKRLYRLYKVDFDMFGYSAKEFV